MPLENAEAATSTSTTPSTDAQTRVNERSTSGDPMGDTIANAFKEIKARAAAAGKDPDEVAGEALEEEAEAKAAAAKAPKKERLRGPNGRYMKPDGTEAAEGETVDAEEGEAVETETTTEAKPEEDKTKTTTPKPHDTAPNTWKREVAPKFAGLDEDVRMEIHRREQDFHNGIKQYKQGYDFGGVMAAELMPHRALMEQHGKYPAQVVKEALGVWSKLLTGTGEQKQQTILQLAKDYGITLPLSAGGAPQSTDTTTTQSADSSVTALQQRLDKLESTQTAQERQRAEEAARREAEELEAEVIRVNAFLADPKNEYANDLRADMETLLRTGGAKDLTEAYDKAKWLNPEVRAKLLAKQDEERARKLAADAANARKAAGANVTRRGTPPVAQKAGSMDDTILSDYRAIVARQGG